MSLEDYIRRLSTTIITELQGPIEASLRGLLAEVLAAAQKDREQAVGALEAQLARLREDHETGQARAEAERESLLEQHASALTALREEVTAEVGQAVLAEARQMAQAEQAEAEGALRALLLSEHEAAQQALRAELAGERDAALEELRSQLLLEREAAEKELREELSRENDERARQAEEAHQQALAALREEVTAEVGQSVMTEAMQAARGEQAVAEHALRARLLAESDSAQEALRAELAAGHDADLDKLRANLAAEHEAALRALREALQRDADAQLAHLHEQARLEREMAVAAALQAAARDRGAPGGDAPGLAAGQADEAEAQQPPPDAVRLAGAIRQIDRATSLTETLAALLGEISAAGPAAIFLVGPDRIRSWRQAGFDAPEGWSLDVPLEEGGPIARAVVTAEVVEAQGASIAPSSLPPWLFPGEDASAFAVPVVVGEKVVAVIYCLSRARRPAATGDDARPAANVEILARHAGRCLEVLTFNRLSTRAAHPIPVHSSPADVRRSTATDATSDASREEESARRCARLLLSEVKLYNEAAVEEGRSHRDLLARLGPEIERARRLYEEKIPALGGGNRSAWFDEELVRTLAGGDASMLGQVT